MKLGLAVLPMDVWADVFVYPWITRKNLAQIVDQFKERQFAEKLQTFLHDPKCGKHSLGHLQITCKLIKNPSKYQMRKWKIPEYRTTLAVLYGYRYKDCKLLTTEMPENIRKFKSISIKHVDDQVIDFLDKIKPLFTNVFLDIRAIKSAPDMRILLAHLLPMLASIRGITCNHIGFEILAADYPRTLTLSKALDLQAKNAHIPVYLDWLNAPRVHGPRFLNISAESKAIFAILDAVHKQFLTATTSASFAIFLKFNFYADRNKRAKEFTVQNVATNEQLAVRNIKPGNFVRYVEILRHPIGADANMRKLVKEWAFDGEAEQMIFIDGTSLTIGQITKNAKAIDHDGDQPAGEAKAGQSTSALKRVKKE